MKNDPSSAHEPGFYVVTCRVGRGVTIGQNVQVVVSKIENGQARIAIRAPRSVGIDKFEMPDRKRDAR